MITHWSDKRAEAIFFGNAPAKGMSRDLIRGAKRKMAILMSATSLEDLAAVPGNRLKAMQGGRKGEYEIRINDQFRLCFRWTKDNNATHVAIVDLHR